MQQSSEFNLFIESETSSGSIPAIHPQISPATQGLQEVHTPKKREEFTSRFMHIVSEN